MAAGCGFVFDSPSLTKGNFNHVWGKANPNMLNVEQHLFEDRRQTPWGSVFPTCLHTSIKYPRC